MLNTLSPRLLQKYGTSVVIISMVLLGLFVSTSHVHASDSDARIEALLRQIAELQALLKGSQPSTGTSVSVQGTAPQHTYRSIDDGKSGRPKITLTAPEQRAVFDKEDAEDPIVVSWKAFNMPKNSVVEIELDGLRLKAGSGVGGGIWQGEIPEGDSTGSYEWEIHGEGHADAGTYRVQASVRACHSDGCDVNPRFPGQEERIKTYARSAWRMLSLIGDEEADAEPTASYKATLNGRTIDSARAITEEKAEARCRVTYNDYDQYEFGFGDVLKCYWGGDKFITVDAWKG